MSFRLLRYDTPSDAIAGPGKGQTQRILIAWRRLPRPEIHIYSLDLVTNSLRKDAETTSGSFKSFRVKKSLQAEMLMRMDMSSSHRRMKSVAVRSDDNHKPHRADWFHMRFYKQASRMPRSTIARVRNGIVSCRRIQPTVRVLSVQNTW